MDAYKVYNGSGDCIGQYQQPAAPEKPDDYDGDWIVQEVSKDQLNTEDVLWWFNS